MIALCYCSHPTLPLPCCLSLYNLLCAVEDRLGPSYTSMTIQSPIYEMEDEEYDEIVDLLLTNANTPRDPDIITTPPPKITKKKFNYVKQRDLESRTTRTPHWNPVGETALAFCTRSSTLTQVIPLMFWLIAYISVSHCCCFI